MINIPLLYHEVPEPRDIFHINLDEPKVALSTEELSARFQSLVETMFGTVGDVRPLALSWTIYVLRTRACWVWLGYWQTPEADWYLYEIWRSNMRRY